MKKRVLALFFLVCFGFISWAQNIHVTQDRFDFGLVKLWNNPPVQFTVYNHSNQSFFFLPQFAQKDLFLEFNPTEVLPGQTGTITAIYYTDQVGKFSKNFDVFISTQTKPISFTIQGTILQLESSALTSCPDFNAPKIVNIPERNIEFRFYDSISKQTILHVATDIGSFNQKPFHQETKTGSFKSMLPLGSYVLRVQANGYHNRVGRVVVSKNNSDIFSIALLPQSVLNPDTTENLLQTEIETKISTKPEISSTGNNNKKTVTFSAIIIDAKTKQPIKDAKVVLENNKYRYAFVRTPQNGKVGQVVFGGNYQLYVEKNGYYSFQIPQNIDANTGLITISLLKDETIQSDGMATNATAKIEVATQKIKTIDAETKKPIGSVIISLESDGYAIKTLISDRNGAVSESFKMGTYQISGEKDGYITTTQIQNIPKAGEDLVLELKKIPVQSEELVRPVDLQKKSSEEVLTPKEAVYKANNIVFLLDVSASMGSNHKLPVMKGAMHKLFQILQDVDNIAVIIYSNDTRVLIPTVSASSKDSILKIIDSLRCDGPSYGQQALQTAYRFAESGYIKGGNNQIILATDGLFNNPDLSEEQIFELVSQKADQGIPISVVAFGKDDVALKFLKKVAKKGGGNYWNIKSNEDSNDMLMKEIKKTSNK